MSKQYDIYLQNHKNAVKEAFNWLKENLPMIFVPRDDVDYEWQICIAHDASKTNPDEYDAYDAYFYGGNRSYSVVEAFNYAWLKHIHRNCHHWQHYILIEDEGDTKALEMPYQYIIEMICDWWSFSFIRGDLRKIFKWYDEHKETMILSSGTRVVVEDILSQIDIRLTELGKIEGV